MLNYSSFMQLAYGHKQKATYEQGDFQTNFFEEIILDVTNNIYEKTYLSNLYNGLRNLTKELVDSIGLTKEKRQNCFTGIKKWLIPNLSSSMLSDFKEKLNLIIENDNTITLTTKNDFKEHFKKDEFPLYVTKVFLYAIKKENIIIKEKLDRDEVELFLEVNKKCPLCNSNLEITRYKKTVYKFSIIDIFPPSLPDKLKSEFEEMHKEPFDSSSKFNKICLCHNCADQYVFTPDIDTYSKLIDKKQMLLKNSTMNERIDSLSLDEEIFTVLKSLKEIEETAILKELRKQPLEIKEKIFNNSLLQEKIIDDVNIYYYYIRSILSQLDGSETQFKIIANSIQNCFLTLTKENLDQEVIYYKISDWIMKKMRLSDGYRTACQIVISFFVQNCEVFDEITQ